MSVRRIVPNLSCADVRATADFYAGLGFDVAMDLGWIMTLASPSNPAAQVSLGSGATADSPGLTIEVDDVDVVYAAAIARGDEIVYPLTDEEWGVRRFFVRDPDGVVINVMSHVE